MTDWTDVANSSVQPLAPLTSETVTALRDNPIAMAEGSSGAPTVEVAWHEIAGYLDTTDTSADITFGSVDVTGYQWLRIVGGYNSNISGAGLANFQVELNLSGFGWQTVFTYTPTNTATMVWFEIMNVDTSSSSQAGQKMSKCTILDSSNTNWAATSGSATTYLHMETEDRALVSGNNLRINPGSNSYQGSTGQATRFSLYGLKRTLV